MNFIDTNIIYNEDCIEGMKKLPDNSVDAVVTDPPFGIGYKYNETEENNNPEDYWKWFKPIYKTMLEKLKPNGFIAIWQTQKYFKYFWEWFGDNIHIYASCKNFVQLKNTGINYAYDPIVMKYNGGEKLSPENPPRNVDFYVSNTAKYVTQTDSLAGEHPCPRPIDQVNEIIANFIIEKGVVLDPFIGSGTTALACLNQKRKFIGFEKEKEFYNIALKRLGKFDKSYYKELPESESPAQKQLF